MMAERVLIQEPVLGGRRESVTASDVFSSERLLKRKAAPVPISLPWGWPALHLILAAEICLC
jgi:hypothetical protein